MNDVPSSCGFAQASAFCRSVLATLLETAVWLDVAVHLRRRAGRRGPVDPYPLLG